MFDWLMHIDIKELLKAPWYNLLRLNDTLRRTRTEMNKYRSVIDDANEILRVSTYSTNMESRLSTIDFTLLTIFEKTIPGLRRKLDGHRDINQLQRVEIEDIYKIIQSE